MSDEAIKQICQVVGIIALLGFGTLWLFILGTAGANDTEDESEPDECENCGHVPGRD